MNENLNSFTRSENTNPFLNHDDFELETDVTHAPNLESWFYIDPHGQEQGPFNADEMAIWYDAGYFDNNVKVRKACESQYSTVGDLIDRSGVIFSTGSTSDLVPLEYVERAKSFINPFRLNVVPKCRENRKQIGGTKVNTGFAGYTCERYAFDISDRLKYLRLEDSQEDDKPQISTRNPIKFNLTETKIKKCEKQNENRKGVSNTEKPSTQKFVSKLDNLQKYWRDVANSKLSGSQSAQHIQIEFNGEEFDAFLESASRVSCLGAGSIEFLKKRNLHFTQYRNPTRTIKAENGENAKIVGHVFITLTYAKYTLNEFKLLVVPVLNGFLYLGTDFTNKLTADKMPTPPHLGSDEPKRYCDDSFFHTLENGQNDSLNSIKQSFPCLEFPQIGKLGLTALWIHRIDLIDGCTLSRIPTTRLEANSMNLKVLDWMLSLDIIEEYKSTSRLPATASYQQGELQLAINLQIRKMNPLIKSDEHRLPRKTEILKRVKVANYISSIHLDYISWQILLDMESRTLTIFEVAGRGWYQFKRMPVGLRNGQQRIYQLMNKIFPKEWQDHWVLFSNELLILSQDFNSHIEHLDEMRKLIDQSGIHVNVQRSKFCMCKIKCLGYIVGSETQRVDPEAYRAISSITRPTEKKQLMNFLKFLEWFKWLLPNYDKTVVPLRLLEHSKTEGSDKLIYPPEACEAFSFIKRFLISDEVLHQPNSELPFYVQSNANFKMVAGLLYQVDNNGRKRAVAYHAKELTAVQKKYSVTELECLALVSSLKQFQSYVDGEHFYVVSDQDILSWILNQVSLPPRLSSWCIALHNYNITIMPRRYFSNDSCERSVFNRVECSFKYKIMDDLKTALFQDYEELRHKIIRCPNDYPDYRIRNGLIFSRREFSSGDPTTDPMVWKLYIPTEMGRSIVEYVHVNAFGGHRTRKEMKRFLQTEFYWPAMGAEIRKLIRKCGDCQD